MSNPLIFKVKISLHTNNQFQIPFCILSKQKCHILQQPIKLELTLDKLISCQTYFNLYIYLILLQETGAVAI